METLEGSVALITGSAQGLGLAIAKQLSNDGADVILADLQAQKAEQIARELSVNGKQVRAYPIDIADSRSVDECFSIVQSEFGRLDIVVNNAAVGQTITPLIELSDADWHHVLQVSLTGTFYCCRAAGLIMKRQTAGCIVNLSSINGLNPPALVGAYNVAKAGVINLTQTLAAELGIYGVRVNAVCPGPVYTDFNKRVMKERGKSLGVPDTEVIETIRQSIPLGRWGKPKDIAQAVSFLCSSRASWVTGEVWRVSGGLSGVSATPTPLDPETTP